MTDNPKISVIVPVYNAGLYLRPCVESILGQTYTNFEVIFIDDASTDQSVAYLQKIVASDMRVKLLENHQRQGAAKSRNLGLKISGGEYIFFLDADDYFEKCYFQSMVEAIRNSGADLVICDYFLHDEQSQKLELIELASNYMPYEKKFWIFKPVEFANVICNFIPHVPWNKIYLRSMLVENQLIFQDLENCNDVAFAIKTCLLARNIAWIRKPLVHYRDKISGQISAQRYKKYWCLYDAWQEIFTFVEDKPELHIFRRGLEGLALNTIAHYVRVAGDGSALKKFWQDKWQSFIINTMDNLPSDFVSPRAFHDYLKLKKYSSTTDWQVMEEEEKNNFSIFADRCDDPIAVWGLGNYGVTLISGLLLAGRKVVEIYDSNPLKHGYIGENIPVTNWQIRKTIPQTIIISSTKYYKEIVSQIKFDMPRAKCIDFGVWWETGEMSNKE